MDINQTFLSKVFELGEAGYQEVIKSGFDPDKHLDDEKTKNIWNWIRDQKHKHGVLPSRELTETRFDTSFKVTTTDSLALLLEYYFDKRLVSVAKDGLKPVGHLLGTNDAKGLVEGINAVQKTLREEKSTFSAVSSVYDKKLLMLQKYEDMEAGKRGIDTPWPTMDYHTNGWAPEDLILLVARPSVGKTFLSLVIANTAYKAGSKVLFVTTEMSEVDILTRLVCIQYKISYTAVMAGKLDPATKKKFKETIENLNDDKRFLIAGNGFNYNIGGIEAAVEAHAPNMLVIDGAYLIKNKGKDQREQVSNNFNDFKRIAKQAQLTCIANTQFNREAAGKKDEEGLAMENIGITDVGGWNADAVYAFWRTLEMENAGVTGINALKVRRNKKSNFKINWNMDTMDFSEITDPNAATFSAPLYTPDKADYDDSGPRDDSGNDIEDLPF